MWSKSWEIARIFSIPLKIHWSFGLMVFYVFFVGWKESMESFAILGFAIFVALLFCCVLLHELGHALMARYYGVSTRDIIISPIGGVARLHRMPQQPWAEFWVAIMGPAVNVAIALVLAIAISVTPLSFLPQGELANLFGHMSNIIPFLLWVNLGLVVFNLIPAFPMDGGRVFRSLLALRWSPLQSTRIASFSGQFIAVAFIFYGVYHGEYLLPFIGVFVFVTAAMEYKNMKRLTAARGQKIFHLAQPLKPLFIDDSMSRVEELLETSHDEYLIVLNRQYSAIGYIEANKIPSDFFPHEAVRDYMTEGIKAVHHSDSIADVAEKFETESEPIFAVTADHYLLGSIRRKDILR
jgi:Zn-dependent protease